METGNKRIIDRAKVDILKLVQATVGVVHTQDSISYERMGVAAVCVLPSCDRCG